MSGTFINARKALRRLRYATVSIKDGWFYNFQLQIKSGKNARFLAVKINCMHMVEYLW